MRNALGLLGSGSVALLLAAACSGGGDDTPGGSSGSSGTTTGMMGGGSGKGSGGSGGTTGGSAGSAVGTGGSSANGGTTGFASGGASTGGSAGHATGGAMAGGSAGMPAMGGSATGGAGSAGMPAGGTSSGSAGAGPGGFTIDVKLASDMKDTAPTTVAIVTWSLDKQNLTAAHIDFGLDTTYGMTAPVDLTAPMYKTLLLGLKPTKMYHFRVVASDASGMYMSDDKTVTAGAKTSLVSFASFTVKDAAKLDKGYFIGSFWQGNGSTVPFIVDTDGDVVWWYAKASGESTDGISRARMSADSKNIWLVNENLTGSPLRRVSMDTLDVQTYSGTKASHDICAVTGDTMAYLDYSESDCNSIFEITPATTGNGKEVFESTGVTGTAGQGINGCHGNAVRYSKKEDAYTYSDWQKDVAVVDRSGMLKWKLSDKTGGNTAWGGKQHGHQLLDNSILIFANDAAGSSKSQAVEFGLDGTLIKKFTSGGGATNFGDVQRLPSGNTLITYSTSNLMQEVDANDAVVLEVKSSANIGYIEYRASLYGEPLDSQ